MINVLILIGFIVALHGVASGRFFGPFFRSGK